MKSPDGLRSWLNMDQYSPEEMMKKAFTFLKEETTAPDNYMAFLWMKEASDAGNMTAAFNLGLFYLRGIGTKIHTAAGMECLKRSAASGNKQAAEAIGYVKSLADDIVALETAARNGEAKAEAKFSYFLRSIGSAYCYKWADKSASQYCPEGLYEKAQCCYGGCGTSQDYAKAYELFLAAAEKHYAPAQWELSSMLIQGLGVERDVEKAAYWAKESAAGGYEPAVRALEEHPIVIPTEDDVQNLIRDANAGNIRAQVALGATFLNGEKWLKRDTVQGVYWLEQAAPYCDADTLHEIGLAYLGIEQEDPKYHTRGLYWLKQAANLGNETSLQYYSFLSYKDQLIAEGKLGDSAPFDEVMRTVSRLAAEGDEIAAALL